MGVPWAPKGPAPPQRSRHTAGRRKITMTRGSMHRRRGAIVAGLCLPFAFLAAQVPAASAGAAPTGPPSAHVLYVTPHGDGTSCRPARPCSIEGAQTRVRQLDKNMRAHLVVQLAGGTYRLSAPLRFTAADSRTNGFELSWQAAPGPKPVLNGGKQVTGWPLADPANRSWGAAVATWVQSRALCARGTPAPVA